MLNWRFTCRYVSPFLTFATSSFRGSFNSLDLVLRVSQPCNEVTKSVMNCMGTVQKGGREREREGGLVGGREGKVEKGKKF